MTRAAPLSGRPLWRLALLAMLALALASRLALGATVGPTAGTASALARLQAVMVMCDPGQPGKPPPPAPNASYDDRLLFELGDNLHALPGAPAPLPLVAVAWTTHRAKSTRWADPPRPFRPAWQPRGPPSRF